MLEIIFILLIGGAYYRLAEKFEKNPWGYAILGVVTYYGTTFVYGMIYGIIYVMNDPYVTEAEIVGNMTLRITAILVGLLIPIILYLLLERNWKRNRRNDREDIDRIGRNL